MRTEREISTLLERLDYQNADSLETQDLDFKEWSGSFRDAVAKIVEAVVCLANGGGGTVVVGVADKIVGRARAVLGVPLTVEVDRLRAAIHNRTDPHVAPNVHVMGVSDGTGRLLLLDVPRTGALHTDTSGRGSVRVGTECMPLTGSQIAARLAARGTSDFTAEVVDGDPQDLISAAAMERLRDAASEEKAPTELLEQSDLDLLVSLGVVRDGRLTRAGVLIAGKPGVIQREVPCFSWTYLQMRTEDDYVYRTDGREALPIALARIEDRLRGENPIQTVKQGLFHFEHRAYPDLALRELLLNAFGHADYQIASPVLLKRFGDRLEVSNPGSFIGGVTPDNILHHPPVARNPALVEALVRLRLVNRSNLGVQRIFRMLLAEGKEPPTVEDLGGVVRFTMRSSNVSLPFRAFVDEQVERGINLTVDHLLILQHVVRHGEIDTSTAARICQRPEPAAREILSTMDRSMAMLDRGGTGSGTYWALRRDVHARLELPGHPDRDRRIDWESAKARVLSALRSRSSGEGAGLNNKDIRGIARLDRNQAYRLMSELRAEYAQIRSPGLGRGARYVWEEEGQSPAR